MLSTLYWKSTEKRAQMVTFGFGNTSGNTCSYFPFGSSAFHCLLLNEPIKGAKRGQSGTERRLLTWDAAMDPILDRNENLL